MPHRTSSSWYTAVSGCVRCGLESTAFTLLRVMRERDVPLSGFALASLVTACEHRGWQEGAACGATIHALTHKAGLMGNVCIGTALLHLYGSRGLVSNAQTVLGDASAERRFLDSAHGGIVVKWVHGRGIGSLSSDEEGRGYVQCKCIGYGVANSLITMFGNLRRVQDAERLFDRMEERDRISWNAMISMYLHEEVYSKCFMVLSDMRHGGVRPDVTTLCSLVSVCLIGSCCPGKWDSLPGKLDEAESLFWNMSRRDLLQTDESPPNYLTFSSALGACSSPEALMNGRTIHAMILQQSLQNILLIGNSLLTMYSKCNSMEDAERVFQSMPCYDVVSCNVLTGGYATLEDVANAMRVFSWMRGTGIKPNCITMINLQGTFRINNKSAISWNAIIAANVRHGHGEEALKLFMDSRHAGNKRDRFCLAECLSSSASLASLEEGMQLHGLSVKSGLDYDSHVVNAAVDMYGKCGKMDCMLKMLPDPACRPTQCWNTLISGYARYGYFKEAEDMFKHMVSMGQKPDYVTFVALLSACSHAGLIDKGMHYYNSMVPTFGVSPGIKHCVCIVDLLGRLGRFAEAEKFIDEMPVLPNDLIWRSLLSTNVDKLRSHMKSIKSNKRPACSWLKLKNEVSTFGIGDRSHMCAEQIYAKLDEILLKLREVGYVADTSSALHDTDEEQKEHNLWNHSEKLALAYWLLLVPEGSTIRIFKNLRHILRQRDYQFLNAKPISGPHHSCALPASSKGKMRSHTGRATWTWLWLLSLMPRQ
ncbi:unnamed protein product [Miscanthus lutarioriparius]|uniref:DYW domain-containing protein n=1 Tax=Miscanthus lutarioriparius TaxID=422564 RepID=A0A811MH00_9POAL|nr:unnamed protein product [Miscanthus lutarioriparius]